MSSSIERVEQAARDAGLDIEVKRMGASTRTAEEAAAQCGCGVGQIVKSLVFQGERSGRLFLFMVSGAHQLDLDKATALVGETLARADPRRIRDETGFAIGGVSPLGHRIALGRSPTKRCCPTIVSGPRPARTTRCSRPSRRR